MMNRSLLLQLKHFLEKNSTTLQMINKKIKLNQMVTHHGMHMQSLGGEHHYLGDCGGCIFNFMALE